MNDERLWIGGRRTILGWEWGRQFTARSGGPHFPTRFLQKAEISEESWLGRLKLPIQRKRFFLRFHVTTKKEEGGLLNISNIAQGLAYRLLLLVKRKARQEGRSWRLRDKCRRSSCFRVSSCCRN